MSLQTSATMNQKWKKTKAYKKKSNFDRKVTQIAKRVVSRELAEEAELLVFDVDKIGLNVTDTAGLVERLTGIGRGDAINERQGNDIKIKSLYMRFQLNANSTATYNSVRIILVRWNGTGVPTINSIILASGLPATMRHLAHLNYSSVSQFQVLYDNTFIVSDQNNLDIPALAIDKFYRKNIGDCHFDDVGAAVKGNLYLCAISDSSVNFPQLTYNSRVRYTDM